MDKPNVWIIDIETFPLTASVWGLRDQNIALNQIKSDWSVMAWGAKKLGDPASKVIYKDVRGQKNLRDDSKILKDIWKILDEADIVITQNGQSFDGPKLNARFMLHGMPPPSPYKHLDTYRIVKRVAEFTSNKLEYLTEKLCTKYKKLSHGKFPGQSLWNECEKDNKEAWDEMKKYNIHDVLSTEELYLKIRAWAPESMPTPHDSRDSGQCKVCGSSDIESRGVYQLKSGDYKKIHCLNCRSWRRGEKVPTKRAA